MINGSDTQLFPAIEELLQLLYHIRIYTTTIIKQMEV